MKKIDKGDIQLILGLLAMITVIFGPMFVVSMNAPPKWLLWPAVISICFTMIFILVAGIMASFNKRRH